MDSVAWGINWYVAACSVDTAKPGRTLDHVDQEQNDRLTEANLWSDQPDWTIRSPWTLPALLAVLLLCLPPLLIELGGRDSTHTMENVALVTSQETWLRCHAGERGAWLMTTNDTAPRVEKPPMLAWLNFLAWSDLGPESAEPSQLVFRARLVAVAMGTILLIAVFWLGCSVGDLRTAIISALVAGSIMFLQRQARTASYDIHFVAWVTLAVASALWAMKPGGEAPSRSRYLTGWILAGLSMAASVMSKNPLPLGLSVLLIGSAMMVLPVKRGRALVGLVAAVLIAAIIVTPWYLYALIEWEDAFRTLRNEFRQPRREPDAAPFYYYLCLLLLVMPWTVFLVASLVHPFTRAARGRRRSVLLPWLWFVLLFVLFSIPDAKQQRYMLPIIPAAGLMIGNVWRDQHELARGGERDKYAIHLIRTHWIVLLIASIGFGLFIAMQDSIVSHIAAWQDAWRQRLAEQGTEAGFLLKWACGDDLPRDRVIGSPGPWWGMLITLLLTALAVWGGIWHLQWKPMRAGILSAVWSLVLLGVFWHCYAGAPSAVHPIRAPAEAFADRLGDAPVRSLRLTEKEKLKYKLNEEFRFYFGRRITHVTPDTLGAYLDDPAAAVYVLARDKPEYDEVMRTAGMVDEGLVQVDKDEQQRLWSRSR
ncbi:MAG: hypothetical protein JSV91_02710 [Phycisphaerales bacterium]|nr:MAG: hypothetical protein JSV91_02710 [Phycisphaerales bacterium]